MKVTKKTRVLLDARRWARDRRREIAVAPVVPHHNDRCDVALSEGPESSACDGCRREDLDRFECDELAKFKTPVTGETLRRDVL